MSFDPLVIEFWGDVAHVSPTIFRVALVPGSILVVSSEPVDEHEHVTLIVAGTVHERWPYMILVEGTEQLMGYGRARILRWRSADKIAAKAALIREKLSNGPVNPLVADDEIQKWVK